MLGPDDFQRQMLTERLEGAQATDPRWAALARRLLDIGGELIAVWAEPDLSQLLDRGCEWPTEGARLAEGERSRCHHNVARLVLGGAAAEWVTGWALSEDGIWRQHSWAFDTVVVETTVPRVAYFGFAMSEAEQLRAARTLGVVA